MTANSLIDETLERVNQGYQPGTLPWMKRSRPEDWKRMKGIEYRINVVALSGNELMLAVALSDYQKFFNEMTSAYREARGLEEVRKR